MIDRKALSIVMAILLVFALLPVNGEKISWDCPECGRTGNTGNYCGNCTHPAPWIAEQTEAKKPESTDGNVWDCPECGRMGNTKNYCGFCGHQAPWIMEQTDPTTEESTDGAEKKKKPDNKYYSNGSIHVEYEFNADDNVLRTNYYNRYGKIVQYEIAQTWDNDGNILSEIIYYPQSSGNYAEYHQSYSYNANGKVIKGNSTLKDGTPSHSWSNEYDADGMLKASVSYDESGSITSYSENYEYDQDGNRIRYTSLDARRNIEYYYSAVWKNGVCIESSETDSSGTVINHETYDPVFGDCLISEWNSGDDTSKTTYSYGANSYEVEYTSISNSNDYQYRFITQYNQYGVRLKMDTYERDENNTEWVLSNESTYETLDNGHTITTDIYTDGKKIIEEADENGNSMLRTWYNPDGSFDFRIIYIYNENGLLIRENCVSESGEIRWYSQYEYDSMGRETRDITDWLNGTMHERLIRYLEDGSKQTKSNWYEDGKLDRESEWE